MFWSVIWSNLSEWISNVRLVIRIIISHKALKSQKYTWNTQKFLKGYSNLIQIKNSTHIFTHTDFETGYRMKEKPNHEKHTISYCSVSSQIIKQSLQTFSLLCWIINRWLLNYWRLLLSWLYLNLKNQKVKKEKALFLFLSFKTVRSAAKSCFNTLKELSSAQWAHALLSIMHEKNVTVFSTEKPLSSPL